MSRPGYLNPDQSIVARRVRLDFYRRVVDAVSDSADYKPIRTITFALVARRVLLDRVRLRGRAPGHVDAVQTALKHGVAIEQIPGTIDRKSTRLNSSPVSD